jgi:hemolysin III
MSSPAIPQNSSVSTLATPRYTLLEEILNSAIHGMGIVLSIIGLVVLVVIATLHGDTRHIVSVSVYGATLILLYTASTVYHSVPNLVAKPALRALDHIAIYFLIAGTYTPFSLLVLRGTWGWSLFAGVWTLALFGVIVEVTSLKRFRLASVFLYLGMGWSALVAAQPLFNQLAPGGLWLLFGGGMAYTLGVPFYLWKSLPFSHAVWHGFVLLGSVLHFFAVLFYVLPWERVL